MTDSFFVGLNRDQIRVFRGHHGDISLVVVAAVLGSYLGRHLLDSSKASRQLVRNSDGLDPHDMDIQPRSARFNRRPFPLKFEKVETITLTHVLMSLILLLMVAGFKELVSIKNGTIDIQTSITDLQNDTSNDANEIKGKLDDVTSAIEASQ
jgi:hypothetical protein